jgi:feruloyl esterase
VTPTFPQEKLPRICIGGIDFGKSGDTIHPPARIMKPELPKPGARPDTATSGHYPRPRFRPAIFGLACAGLTTGVAAPDGNDALAALKELKIHAATITVAEHDATPTFTDKDGQRTNLPPRTMLKMVLNPAKGSNINVEIWLPDADKWNGRLLGLGNGGSAGSINSSGLIAPLMSGYAVAATDMGTAPNADSGIGNPEVWKDFGFRATHLMTVAAKQVIKAYYGKAPEYSYFSGGSTGGQQGLQEAQRYPGDYDGIVATIAAHCRTPLHAYFLWNDQILRKCPFTESQQANIIAAGNEYMASRETPATAGKLVSDPRCDSKDIEAVIALAMQKDATMTKEHADALRKLFDGPKHAITGERIFCGIPFGSPFDIARRNLYLFTWVFGAKKDTMDIDFGKDIDTYTAALGPYLTAEKPDLSGFEKRGGKLIMTVGSADSCVPYHASIDYYEQVVARLGSLEKVRSFFRFYIVPGMSHGPGPGINNLPNLLKLVSDWREHGTAPDKLDAKRVVDGKTEFEIPLYPYPTKINWDTETNSFQPADGPRGGVDPIATRFLPPAAEETSPP